jgi:hypothetical protein
LYLWTFQQEAQGKRVIDVVTDVRIDDDLLRPSFAGLLFRVRVPKVNTGPACD